MCRLALAMGRPNLAAFAAELDEKDYQTWQAYYAAEPWDGRLHAAQITQAIEAAMVVFISTMKRLPPGTIEPSTIREHMVSLCQ